MEIEANFTSEHLFSTRNLGGLRFFSPQFARRKNGGDDRQRLWALEEWNQQLDVNLRAAFLLSQAFITEMKKASKGTLVFINSIAGRQPFSQSAAYVSSKFALRGFASSLREELRSNNIKVISHIGIIPQKYKDFRKIKFVGRTTKEKEEVFDF